MGRLNPKDKELVALGAALGSNCIPCVVYHLGAAEKIGLPDAAEPQPKELSRLAASGQLSAISDQPRKIVYFLHSISLIRDW